MAHGVSFLPRPLQENKQGEEIVVNSRPSDMIYIQSCSSCKFKVKSKSAKCIIGEWLLKGIHLAVLL